MNKDTGFMGSVTVGPKGQIVIPQEARSAMNILEGDKLLVLKNHDNALVLLNGKAIDFLWQNIEKQTGASLPDKSAK